MNRRRVALQGFEAGGLMNRMKFFEKFEMARDRAGYTSSAVADATGIAKSTISNWEGRGAGEIKVNLAAMGKLARMLGVPLDYLADDAQDEPPVSELTDAERPILDMVRTLGIEESRRRLLQAQQSAASREGSRTIVASGPGVEPLPPPASSRGKTGRNSG